MPARRTESAPATSRPDFEAVPIFDEFDRRLDELVRLAQAERKLVKEPNLARAWFASEQFPDAVIRLDRFSSGKSVLSLDYGPDQPVTTAHEGEDRVLAMESQEFVIEYEPDGRRVVGATTSYRPHSEMQEKLRFMRQVGWEIIDQCVRRDETLTPEEERNLLALLVDLTPTQKPVRERLA